MRYMESGIDRKVTEEIDEQIDLFLDEFMNEEYKGRDHIVARQHYDKVFHELLPKHLQLIALILCKSTAPSEMEESVK